MENKRYSIGFALIVKNEEKTIRKTLESIKWADEIVVVVDDSSNDKTEEIAKEYTDKVYLKKWEGYGKQRNYSLSFVTTDWVFIIDGDEAISDELKNELRNELDEAYDGYEIFREAVMGKQSLKCKYFSSYQNLRLFKNGLVKYTENYIHEHPVFNKEVPNIGRLKNKFFHYFTDLHEWMESLNRYTLLAAERKLFYEKRNYSKTGLILHMFLSPIDIFFITYFKKGGFRDGVIGFAMALSRAYSTAIEYAKIYEMLYLKDKNELNEEV